MKIILLCNSLSGGGAEKVASDTLEILKRSSLFEVLVASADPDSDIKLTSYKSKSIISAFFNIKNFFTLLKSLKKEKPQVVHIHNYLSDLTFSVIWAIFIHKLFFDLRVVQTLHDHHLTCPNSSLFNDKRNARCVECIGGRKTKIIKNSCYQGSFLKSLFKYLRFSFAYFSVRNTRVIDLFLCPSQFIQNLLLEDGFSIEKTKIVKNPISPIFLSDNFLTPKKNSVGRFNVIYLGRLVKVKSIGTLIEAIALCQKEGIEITLDICGEGDTLGELMELAEYSGVKDKIFFRGRISPSEILKLAEGSEIIVLPSVVYENAPLVIYEGVSLGLFPIVSNIGGMLETVDTLEFGLTFEAGNAESLKQSIMIYIANRSEYLGLRDKAVSKIKEGLNDTIYLSSLIASYHLEF